MKSKWDILPLHLMNAARRIFGVPNFRYYDMAERIIGILTKSGSGILRIQPALRQTGLQQTALFKPYILGERPDE